MTPSRATDQLELSLEHAIQLWRTALQMRFDSLCHELSRRFRGAIELSVAGADGVIADTFHMTFGGRETALRLGPHEGETTASVTVDGVALSRLLATNDEPGTVFRVSGDYSFYHEVFRALRAPRRRATSWLGVRSEP